MSQSVSSVDANLKKNSTRDNILDGKLIPKGASVLVAPNAMGRSAELWKNPNEFNPERFEKDNMQGMHAYSNVVFSAGARNCIGKKSSNIFNRLSMNIKNSSQVKSLPCWK